MFRDGKRNGKGCRYWSDGKLEEEGYYAKIMFL